MRSAGLLLVMLLGCSFDWNAFDPRLGATTGTAGASVGGAGMGGGAGTGGASSGAGGTGGGVALRCPEGRGAAMVDLGAFCIDATEATNAHYAQFIAALVPPQSQTSDPPYCSWNTTYVPDPWPPVAGMENVPVSGMDWCDAHAFCAWAGKRLCGPIGVQNSFAVFADPTKSEWHYACTQGGETAYPYGSIAVTTICNTSETGLDLQDVGTFPRCRGTKPPFDQIFDMSGNVHEWSDECDDVTGAGDLCRFRDGSHTHTALGSACNHDEYQGRAEYYPNDNGIRCCAGKR